MRHSWKDWGKATVTVLAINTFYKNLLKLSYQETSTELLALPVMEAFSEWLTVNQHEVQD